MRPARFEHARAERSEARLERATSWFVARRNEATGGSSRQLLPGFPECSRHLRPPEAAGGNPGLSAVCQSS